MNFITLIICIFPPHDGEKIFKCILSCIYSLIMLMYAKYNNIYFWISLHVKWIYEYYKHLYTTHNCFICFHIFLNIIGWKHFEKWNWFLWPNAELSIDFTFNTLNSPPPFSLELIDKVWLFLQLISKISTSFACDQHAFFMAN